MYGKDVAYGVVGVAGGVIMREFADGVVIFGVLKLFFVKRGDLTLNSLFLFNQNI